MTESLFAFLTLTLMEIVLGVDNIIFIAIQVSRLPKHQQFFARTLGLVIALVFRVILLLSLSWVMSLTQPLFDIMEHTFSGRDLLLLAGGLFLVAKATVEIHHKIEDKDDHSDAMVKSPGRNLAKAIVQISIIDIVFSFDSIITAVGMTQNIGIMIAAVVCAMIVMIAISGKIAQFIDENPTIKILSLAFLIMIGIMLLSEGMGVHAPRGYLYFAMFFSLSVELLNMRYRKKVEKKKK